MFLVIRCSCEVDTLLQSQGLSLNQGLVDIGPSVFSPGMTYVALSRFRRLDKLSLIDFDPTKVECDTKAFREYQQLRRKFHPNQSLGPTRCNELPPQYQAGKRKRKMNVKARVLAQVKSGQVVQAAATPFCRLFVPLKNEGNTCYANCIIQSLLQVTPFKAAVQEIGNIIIITITTFVKGD